MENKQGRPPWLESPPQTTFGYSILKGLTLPLGLFLFVLIILVSGVVLISTSIRSTTKAWWKRLRS